MQSEHSCSLNNSKFVTTYRVSPETRRCLCQAPPWLLLSCTRSHSRTTASSGDGLSKLQGCSSLSTDIFQVHGWPLHLPPCLMNTIAHVHSYRMRSMPLNTACTPACAAGHSTCVRNCALSACPHVTTHSKPVRFVSTYVRRVLRPQGRAVCMRCACMVHASSSCSGSE